MNNKGFTLIELLAVIAIVSILGIIFTVNYTKSINSANQKECDLFVKEIEDAACVYAGLSPARQDSAHRCAITMTNGCDLTVEFLVSQGLINSEVDSCTGAAVESLTGANDYVEVRWSSGNKTCEFKGTRIYEK